jgi:nucleotide-binding universal stress UspA family protein
MISTNFKNIIVPVDFSETSLGAVDHAAFLARKNGATITFINVMEPVSKPGVKPGFSMYNIGEVEEKLDNLAKKQAEMLDRKEIFIKEGLINLERKMKREGIAVGKSIIEKGKVYKKVCAMATKLKADIIIMGTHGASGFREFMVGSNTYKVVSESKCPVLSIKAEFTIRGFKNILLPFIDQPHMREHVDYAIKLAKIYGATLHILGIDTEKEEDHFKKVRVEAEQIKNMAEKAGILSTSDVFPASYVNEIIMNYGKNKKADLIVIMADLEKLNVLQYFTGPVVQQIVNHSAIPVLSIPLVYNPKVAAHAPLF